MLIVNVSIAAWFGTEFSNTLGINIAKFSTYDWNSYLAPPMSETICPTCPITTGEARNDFHDLEL